MAFYIFFAAHALAAFFSPIQDCDEVYNYWEPTHYLNHGHGLQTWEYAPDYALRSWLYASLHAMVIYIGSWLPFVNNKAAEFYFLRLIFAAGCAMCEMQLFKTISKAMNPRIAIIFMVVLASSAGMFHAAVSYLPSSFAMYFVCLAMAAFMDWTLGIGTALGLFWLSVGTVVGWPFVGALAIPYVVEEVVMCYFTDDLEGTATRLFSGLCAAFVVLVAEITVDWFFYRTLVVYPFRLAWYNIFGGSGKGPNIFGTEPWHYYIRNLFINFNLWFVLALAVWPLILYQRRISGQASSRLPFFRAIVTISPFYLWLTIFTVQPHKEERFMYPIYPCLALNAAVSLHIIITIFDIPTTLPQLPSTTNKEEKPTVQIAGTPPVKPTPPPSKPVTTSAIIHYLKLLILGSFLLSTTFFSTFRSLNLATAYHAPISIYTHLPHANSSSSTSGSTVCLAKEWYRFPSTYHLPPNYRPAFIPSSFHGLLPGTFSEADNFGFFPGAYLDPGDMNDENIEDLGKYTREEGCDFLVDSWFEGGQGISEEQPDRVRGGIGEGGVQWERIKCERFLDQERTGVLGRLFWMPEGEWVPRSMRRAWGEYCLLKRKV